MGIDRQVTESQLANARRALEARVAALKTKGVELRQFKRDPVWRNLDAKVRQILGRLHRVGEAENLNAELARLKEENAQRRAAKKAEKKRAKKAKPEKEKAKAPAKAAGKKEKAPKKEKAE
jgi:hypothetical protein